jgi:hypothetical protein
VPYALYVFTDTGEETLHISVPLKFAIKGSS